MWVEREREYLEGRKIWTDWIRALKVEDDRKIEEKRRKSQEMIERWLWKDEVEARKLARQKARQSIKHHRSGFSLPLIF